MIDLVVSSQVWILLWGSHLEYNISSQSIFSWSNLCSSIDVVLVWHISSFSCILFNYEVSSIDFDHFLDDFWSHGDSGLIFMNFFGQTNDKFFGIDTKEIYYDLIIPHYNLEKYRFLGFVIFVLFVLKANLPLLSDVGWIGGWAPFFCLLLL